MQFKFTILIENYADFVRYCNQGMHLATQHPTEQERMRAVKAITEWARHTHPKWFDAWVRGVICE